MRTLLGDILYAAWIMCMTTLIVRMMMLAFYIGVIPFILVVGLSIIIMMGKTREEPLAFPEPIVEEK